MKKCFVETHYGRNTPCHFGCTDVCKRFIVTKERGGGPFNLFIEDTPDFAIPFADLGSGVVSTTETCVGATATFTRATTATTVGSTGLVIKGVASGSPRSRYDPTSLEYQGYFAEGARTNICLQSEDLATTWTNARSTETVNATTAPDGTSTADKLVEDATAGATHHIAQAITYTNAVHTFSVWGKAAERSSIRLILGDGTTNHGAFFTLTGAGTVGTTLNCSATIKAYPNGWYRCAITTNAATAAAAGDIQIRLCDATPNDSYNGDGASGAYVWGAQVEAGSFASSYIPTTTASVTRNADVLVYPFILNAGRGTFYAELATLWSVSPGAAAAAVGFVVSGVNGAPLGVTAGDAPTVIRCRDAAANNAAKSGLTDMSTGIRKRAGSWGSLGLIATGDGASVATATFGGGMGSTGIGIGCDGNGGTDWFGTIKNARGWLAQASAAQLISITS